MHVNIEWITVATYFFLYVPVGTDILFTAMLFCSCAFLAKLIKQKY